MKIRLRSHFAAAVDTVTKQVPAGHSLASHLLMTLHGCFKLERGAALLKSLEEIVDGFEEGIGFLEEEAQRTAYLFEDGLVDLVLAERVFRGCKDDTLTGDQALKVLENAREMARKSKERVVEYQKKHKVESDEVVEDAGLLQRQH